MDFLVKFWNWLSALDFQVKFVAMVILAGLALVIAMIDEALEKKDDQEV